VKSNEGRSEVGHVALLLATRNGARFLPRQLETLDAQTWQPIDIFASDDGSTDQTLSILSEAATIWRKGKFTLFAGPGRGFAENFRSLLTRPEVDAAYVGFADQDDVWTTNKLARAVAALAPFGDRPALYCGRTRTVDETEGEIGLSPLFERQPGFGNALVQSIAGGNTMVFNRAAHGLLRAGALRTGFVSHDWFAYQLISGAGGAIIYAPEPTVLYRQHGDNLVGSNQGWRARLARIRAAWGGRFSDWNARNIATLSACRDLLTPEARMQLDQFAAARQKGVIGRMLDLRRSGVYRQTSGGQLSLHLAALMGKF
jgi:glycosyltransferase involved in cell wall biosynthesis